MWDRRTWELPVCKWRRPSPVPGRQGCESPIVAPGPFGVMDHECWQCRYADHLDPNARSPVAPTAGEVRHLLYHLYPFAGDEWRWNVNELRQRIGLFNGRRIVAAAFDGQTASPREVELELQGMGCDLLRFPNDPGLREMTTYPRLLRELAGATGPGEVHLYAHGKGVTSCRTNSGTRAWAATMYSSLLDYWPAVRRELRTHALCGVYRRKLYLVGHPGCHWHYSGSFRWARNADWFGRRWDAHAFELASPETHPGSLFAWGECSCLFGDHDTPRIHLYDQRAWDGWAGEARDAWTKLHREDYAPLWP